MEKKSPLSRLARKPDTGQPGYVPLSKTGITVRLIITFAVFATALISNQIGSDDNFPFAPFKMFSAADDPNQPVDVAFLQGTDSSGATMDLFGSNTGLRRAEIEGRMDDLNAHPERVEEIAKAYHHRQPDRPRLVEIRLGFKRYPLKNGQLNGDPWDEVTASWKERP